MKEKLLNLLLVGLIVSGFASRLSAQQQLAQEQESEATNANEITEAYEKRVILEMLAQTNWSQTEAAERFKIPLSTLNQKIRRLQIEVKRRREEA